MNIESFETISPLGLGTYARVFLVKHKSSQQLMAAKVMKKKFIQKKKAISQILNEKNIL
jgi:serine/threonine protein kinase